jgi:hypothetical protein
MKKVTGILSIAALVSLFAGAAIAGPNPGTGIYESVHDLTNGPAGGGPPSSVPGFVSDPQQRLCCYCHTPHHAIQPGDPLAGPADFLPLWSHQVSTQSYIPYASVTFSPFGGQTMAADPLIGPSRLCMSCHDGITAVDNYYGESNNHAMQNPAGATSFTGQPVVSLNGQTNHPLGFAMSDVIPGYPGAAHADNANILALTDASTYVTGEASSVSTTITSRLYGGAIMTCSSCHDVHNTLNHVSYQATAGNFLLLGTQKNSGICLSCHTQGGGDTGAAQTSVPSAAFTY